MSEKNKTTKSEEIWEEIKNKEVLMFALPNQTVNMYCKPVSIDPNRLFLEFRTTSFFPALEAALGNKFNIELVNKWLVVTRNETNT